MTDYPFDDPDVQEWARHVREDLVPKVRQSAVGVSLVTAAEPDVKFAVELGMMILLDKPIIAVVYPGVVVPEHLTRAADALVEGPTDSPGFGDRLQAAITRVLGVEKA